MTRAKRSHRSATVLIISLIANGTIVTLSASPSAVAARQKKSSANAPAFRPMADSVSARQKKSSASAPASKRMADGKQWTIHNLDVPAVPSYCYDNSEAKCQQYGRLYTWESSRRACQLLGSGWRLPTDAEWRKLAKGYGGIHDDSTDRGKVAHLALLGAGSAGFNAVLGGGREPDGQYARGEAHGFYWTSSEVDPKTAIFYNFGHGGPGLYRQLEGEKENAFSVRCVKD